MEARARGRRGAGGGDARARAAPRLGHHRRRAGRGRGGVPPRLPGALPDGRARDGVPLRRVARVRAAGDLRAGAARHRAGVTEGANRQQSEATAG